MHWTGGLVEHGGADADTSHSLTSAVQEGLEPSVVHPCGNSNDFNLRPFYGSIDA